MSHYLKGFKEHKDEYNSSGLTANEFMEEFKDIVKNVIPKELESCTIRKLDKGIQHALRLKREFLSFAKEHDMDERELRILFIKKNIFLNYYLTQISMQRFSKLKRKIKRVKST